MNGLFSMLTVLFVMIFGIGIIAVLAEHFQKMAKIRADAQKKQSRDVLDAIAALRQEVADLRDTTTKYDLSFDTALQRLEGRVTQLEGRLQAAEESPAPAQIHARR